MDCVTFSTRAPDADPRGRPPSAGPLVQIRDLRLNFRTFDGISKVLNGVDLTLERGDILGLVGETGCGKTMTALSIPRLIPCPPGEIVSGEVIFDGDDVLALDDAEVRRMRAAKIGMIFQDPTTSLNPVFTIGEQMTDVILCRQGHGSTLALAPLTGHVGRAGEHREAARKVAVEWLARVAIPDPERRLRSYPHELSGGMRQRVLIAMAMAGEPPLIIADEPTTALDVSIQAQILRLLAGLVQEFHLTVLLITHNLGVVAKMCTRVAVMYAGVVVEEGTVQEVFKDPKHPYTRALLAAVPSRGKARGALQSIAGSVPDLLAPPPGCRFHPRCPHAMPECAVEPKPAVRLITTTHRVACHLY
jgi:peptide/nickel transport system ATP-binding protein